MKKSVTALALVLCLTLTACGGKRDSQGQTSFLGAAAGLDEEETLVTVDGAAVPAWRYLYWLAYTCDHLAEQYAAASLPLDWDAPLEGGTLADYARDQALADTALYATVERWAEQYGCTLTDEDLAGLSDQWAENAAAHGGEESYLAQLAELGLDRPRAEELAGVGRMYAKLSALSAQAGSPLAPTAEELAAFAQEQGSLTVDRILIAAGEDREAAGRRAAEVFARLNAAQDQGAEFTALAADGDDPAGPRTLAPGEEGLEASLVEAARALEPGQCSGILESQEGFSILRRLESDGEALAADYFDQQLEAAAREAEIQTTEGYQTLSPAAFYRELGALRAQSGGEK